MLVVSPTGRLSIKFPSGAGLAVKAIRYGDEAVPIAAKAAGALAKTDNVTDAGSAAKGVKCALNCFVADTQVIVPEGTSSIEEVAPGDEVLAYDPASEGDWIPIEAEPGPDPSACDPESDPACEKQVVPAAEEVSDVE